MHPACRSRLNNEHLILTMRAVKIIRRDNGVTMLAMFRDWVEKASPLPCDTARDGIADTF